MFDITSLPLINRFLIDDNTSSSASNSEISEPLNTFYLFKMLSKLKLRKRTASEDLNESSQKKIRNFVGNDLENKSPKVLQSTSVTNTNIYTSDIKFSIKGVQIPACRSLLASASDVFNSMFYGLLREQTKIIEVPDVEPEAFAFMQDYLKSMNSVKDENEAQQQVQNKILVRNCSLELALETYYAANKYQIKSLEDKMMAVIMKKLEPQNVLYVLPYARAFNVKTLESKCWYTIEWNTKKVLQSEAFPQINFETLCLILENSRLKISEFELFQHVLRWGDALLRSPEGRKWKTLQGAVGLAIYKIRFPTMTSGEFYNCTLTKILKQGEIAEIVSLIKRNEGSGETKGDSNDPNAYCTIPRRHTCYCRNARIMRSYRVIEIECPLCTNNIVSVDGQSYRMMNKTDFKGTYPNYSCECIKYSSCPSFPNGETACLIEKMNNKTLKNSTNNRSKK